MSNCPSALPLAGMNTGRQQLAQARPADHVQRIPCWWCQASRHRQIVSVSIHITLARNQLFTTNGAGLAITSDMVIKPALRSTVSTPAVLRRHQVLVSTKPYPFVSRAVHRHKSNSAAVSRRHIASTLTECHEIHLRRNSPANKRIRRFRRPLDLPLLSIVQQLAAVKTAVLRGVKHKLWAS